MLNLLDWMNLLDRLFSQYLEGIDKKRFVKILKENYIKILLTVAMRKKMIDGLEKLWNISERNEKNVHTQKAN